jgi:type II secretory pathway pseudopilin PulG
MSGNRLFPPDCGIAIGPILFVIAILAILAAAIAASSGSYTGGTTQEKAKIMASTLISQMNDLDNCVAVVRGNGFEDTQLDFSLPAGTFVDAAAADWTWPTTSVVGCTSDACNVFKTAGGGCTPQTVALTPEDAADQNVLNAWGAGCVAGNNAGCRESYPYIAQFQIEGGANAPLHLIFGFEVPINKDVCMEINTLAGVANPNGDAPHGNAILTSGVCGAYDCTVYSGASWSFDSSMTFTSSKDFCFWQTAWSQYQYIHVLN